MIDLYPNDRRNEQIRAAVNLLISQGYHVVRPERLNTVYTEQRLTEREMASADHVPFRKILMEKAASNTAHVLARDGYLDLRDVTSKPDSDNGIRVLRTELRVVVPHLIEHAYLLGDPLLNAIDRLRTIEASKGGRHG